MNTAIIFNPTSGQGKSLEVLKQLEEEFPEEVSSSRVCRTHGRGHATVLVRQLVSEGFNRLVILGGDGTWSEAVNGAMTPSGQLISPQLQFALIPGGSGCDFLRTPPFFKNQLFKRTAMLGTHIDQFDLLKVQIEQADNQKLVRFALNSTSAGISGRIAKSVSPPLPFFSASSQYLLFFFKFFWKFPPPLLHLTVEDQLLYDGPILNVFFCNGRYSGGGLCWAPGGLLDDGRADLLVVSPVRKRDLPRYIPKLLKGRINQIPEALAFKVSQVHARFTPPTLMEIDGEVFQAKGLHLEVIPQILPILTAE
jgi:diacylglycerol kinase family enzyme